MALKFIKLFEDYTQDIKIENSEVSHTWSEVRDAIQMKRPFVIVIFKNSESYADALKDYFNNIDYIKQKAILHLDGKTLTQPSIFFVRDRDSDFSNEVKKLYSDYKVLQVIVGDAGSEYADRYAEDGTSSEVGNEVVSTLEPKDFGTDDCFKLGSTYYKFVGFDS